MELIDNSKQLIEDKEFAVDVRDEDLSKRTLKRVFAVKKAFVGVSFKQSELLHCYFRNCRFIRCDFTGTSISRSNFRGSQYEECKFQYSSWEHTVLDDEFLDNCLPSEENLARDLVRSLRVNFGHIGNYSAVNRAASIEVALTGLHLFHAAYSKQSYYRAKYKSCNRIVQGIRHAQWKALDLLWGNGESLCRIVVCGLFAITTCAAILTWQEPLFSWPGSFGVVASAFWGISTTPPVPGNYLVALTAIRFLLFGLFMAVLIKRLARR
ncbi:MAG: pentapeptide repeat-containing protein [Nitrosomonas sp.]|nr:pentapeptide repeat-containing protein [Nitrosomonas sp.]